ncbi:MAG: hypothetical protein V8R83_03120 [Candidatus Gastranaerophilaceae bacterium]|uniref:EF-hand domain-containing protein n=1 Tax=Candidatus Limenecus avicola TaxID=2840847 RepID=A0A9D1MYR7_9CLOT|nr:hypothetical protein [Clostridium sp.]HIU91952.1 hypothetical protein [Candidatus Limenecus avicola]
MDTSINAINSVSTSTQKTQAVDKQSEKIKELAQEYDFDYFDVDNDGKLSGTELTKLKSMFNSVDFDVDEDDAVDESAFNSALSEYKES